MKNGGSMLKRILASSVMLLMLSMVAAAAPADCTTIATLQELISASEGCAHLDKIFTNFSYSLGDAALVSAGHVYSSGVDPTKDIHGWNFQRETPWTTGFTLAYTITVDASAPLQRINATKDQQNSGLTPNGTTITDTQTVLDPLGQVVVLNTNGTAPAETVQGAFVPLARSIRTSSVFTPNGGQLVSYEQQWFQTAVTAIPEPGTWLLCGGALMLVGLLGKRRSAY